MKTKLIVLVGPTAVGKTALGIELAQHFNGEIISGDSQQVYRQLAIGTAKPTQTEQEQAVHHLIDVRDVAEGYSAYDFVVEARRAIADCVARGKVPILVGGTGLYIQSLLEGYHLGGELDQAALLSYRSQLEEQDLSSLQLLAQQQGLPGLEVNRRRLIRQLELARFGQDLVNQASPYQSLLLGLTDERALVYDRINQRVDQMVEQGLLEEARWLHTYYPTSQAAMGIGYKELFPYLEGEMAWQDAIEKVKQNSRRFAKRQLTWFRNRMDVTFYTASSEGVRETIRKAVEEFIND